MSNRRKPHRSGAGRPTLLSEDVESRIIAASRTGIAVELAAEAAGISSATYHRWMARGRAEVAAREDGQAPNRDEDPYVELFEKVRTARAMAGARAMANIRRVADGGIVTKVTTRKFRDPETGQIVEEVTEDRTAPDWRADAWYLERQHRHHYGKDAAIAVEITGIDAGVPEEESSVDLAAIAERLNKSLFAVQYPEPPELEDGSVLDAEVVDG
ncbi:hypothetical protein [Streptomyces griseocarneus]|uniref:hypothetical protein n=1 Tax=Streptomyces griseocarneus TaxID=51201 RepID=UPI00167DB16A|nr:hypothetical protein [Streptomyces griseocarneus]MBZ6476640.1 hypothetical protein [Streptomyces griseocarneus]GHG80095.1 hypothetical protein GCM10018779_61330 [Streptomyces griseocarneus]